MSQRILNSFAKQMTSIIAQIKHALRLDEDKGLQYMQRFPALVYNREIKCEENLIKIVYQLITEHRVYCIQTSNFKHILLSQLKKDP